MKRIIFVFLLFIVASIHINAQLLVDNNGNVRVKNSNSSTNASYFAINGTGDSTISSYIFSNSNSQNIALRIIKHSQVNENGNTHAVFSSIKQAASSPRKAYGLYGSSDKFGGEDTNCGRSFGVYGVAGNSTPGWNYGVFGTLVGDNNGAGVFGSSESLDGGINTQGKYAGYFHGKVKSTNTMYAPAFTVSSDYRLKENIQSIEQEYIDNIMKLNVVKYHLKQFTVDVGDTASIPIKYYTEDDDLLKKEHFGLIAQELQDLYPDLVYEGEDGYLSVNYMEIIPLLIQSIQSLKEEVEMLKANKKTTKRVTSSDQIEKEISSVRKISVSTESVSVSCNISSSVKNANIFIYDAIGNQIYNSNIRERGHIEVNIKRFTLNDGIYVCSLLTDDNIDSRRFYFGK